MTPFDEEKIGGKSKFPPNSNLIFIYPIEKDYGKKAQPSDELAVKVQISEKYMTLMKSWSFKAGK